MAKISQILRFTRKSQNLMKKLLKTQNRRILKRDSSPTAQNDKKSAVQNDNVDCHDLHSQISQ
ncbi:hypothetical protein [Helicobacter sp. 23-1045]